MHLYALDLVFWQFCIGGRFVFICEILSRLIYLYLQKTMHMGYSSAFSLVFCTCTLLSVCLQVEFSFPKQIEAVCFQNAGFVCSIIAQN